MMLQVLVSTMNQANVDKLVSEMKIHKYVVINQVTDGSKLPQDIINDNNRALSYRERGLSLSRNRAIANSTADICVIADDDMYYVDNYEKIILDAYHQNTDADIIAFQVSNEDGTEK
jgi:glycosyltransferase involved in cell wall biosynthesis